MPRSASAAATDLQAHAFLLVALLLAAATDALPQALGQVAALEVAGSLSASADEGSFFALSYAVGKLIGLGLAPVAVSRLGMGTALRAAVYGEMACCALLASGIGLDAALLVRLLQGLFGGAITAGAYGALVAMVPKQHHAVAQGAWGCVTLVMPAVFSALTGALTDAANWHRAMLLPVFVGLLAVYSLGRALRGRPSYMTQEAGAIDGFGLLLFGGICAAAQFLANMGTRYNWGDRPWMWPLCWGLGLSAALFTLRQLCVAPKKRLVHAGAFALPEFAFACATSTLSGYAATATAMLAPMYVRRLFGFAAQDAGVLQLPSLLPIVAALAIGVLATRYNWLSAMQLIVTGLLLFLGSLWLWAQATWQVDLTFVALVMALRGAALGLMAVPTARIAFARLEGTGAVWAAGHYQFARQWGGLLATLSVTWRLAETQARFRYQITQHLLPPDPALVQRAFGSAQALIERGVNSAYSDALGPALSNKALTDQVLVLAYNACFIEIMVVYGVSMTAALGYRFAAQRR